MHCMIVDRQVRVNGEIFKKEFAFECSAKKKKKNYFVTQNCSIEEENNIRLDRSCTFNKLLFKKVYNFKTCANSIQINLFLFFFYETDICLIRWFFFSIFLIRSKNYFFSAFKHRCDLYRVEGYNKYIY